jgi:hypothetical protein
MMRAMEPMDPRFRILREIPKRKRKDVVVVVVFRAGVIIVRHHGRHKQQST